MADRHQLMVYLCSDTMTSEEGMYRESEVESRTTRWHRLYLSLRCEDKYLACKEVQFDSVEEVHSVRLRVIENLLDGTKPVVEFRFILSIFLILQTILVFPVCCESLFCHLVHTV